MSMDLEVGIKLCSDRRGEMGCAKARPLSPPRPTKTGAWSRELQAPQPFSSLEAAEIAILKFDQAELARSVDNGAMFALSAFKKIWDDPSQLQVRADHG
jgi:hypothetical protein